MESTLHEIYTAVIDGESQEVQQAVIHALESGVKPEIILEQSLIKAMAEVGRRFEEGDFFVPEMLIAARAMQGGLALLKPHLMESDVRAAGTVVIGTVKGDLHDIGKNLVSMMLEGAGFEVIDLGTDVAPNEFVDAVKTHNANIVALSALLTTTMPNMKATVDIIRSSGLQQKVCVMIGGAPVTDSYAASIGADGYAPDASRAVAVANQLIRHL